MRLRGRVEGKRVVPYYCGGRKSRAATRTGRGKEILWVDDPSRRSFSRSKALEDPTRLRARCGESPMRTKTAIPFSRFGLFPGRARELKLGEDLDAIDQELGGGQPAARGRAPRPKSSFVFFRELPSPIPGAAGRAFGVPLVAGPPRSQSIHAMSPLGAPVFLATTLPASTTPMTRLVLAQDSGGAIRNPVARGFSFWGSGAEAGALAGARDSREDVGASAKGVKPASPRAVRRQAHALTWRYLPVSPTSLNRRRGRSSLVGETGK